MPMNKSAELQSPTNFQLERLSGWRKMKDRLTNFFITAGGMGVLAAILLIFFYLFYEIVPLFQSASIKEESSYQLPVADHNDILHLSMEEQADVALLLNGSGELSFFRAKNGDLIEQHQLAVDGEISAFQLNSEQNPLIALGSSEGAVTLTKPIYKTSYPNDQRLITPDLIFPYGNDSLQLSDSSLDAVAVRDSEEQLLLLAYSDGHLVGRQYEKVEDFLTDELALEEQALNLPVISIIPKWIKIGPDLRWVYLIAENGQYHVIDLFSSSILESGKLTDGSKVNDVRFLLGGISLMVAANNGEISQWFMVRESGKTPRLEKIRHFEGSTEGIEKLIVEHRRKGFLTIDSSQQLDVFYSTSGRHLLSENISDNRVNALAISPRANAILSVDEQGLFRFFHLENEHPEVSWSVLWNKVWYESYTEPNYTWQSSASNNDFEAKFSFTPLAFGTLKAAFYAMLLAAPLALCGAIYTAYFMTPAVRKKVKPLIELMEALPTVILGFLAGLWLAPFFERNLSGVFSLFLLFPFGILAFGYAWNCLPSSIRLKVPDGWHAVLLVPVVILLSWGCISANSTIELLFFDGDMRSWLTHDLGISFDQRNAMVVGVAMGFAVIPTIFSIAEDALFSVPKSLSYGSLALGATTWQTLVGVVLPTASPGIFSALMIGMGRAVGETMIVLMATGNTPIMDANIFEGMRTLAANIAVEIGETEVDSSHYRVLFLAAFVLFLFTFVVNTAAEIVRQRLRKKYGSL